MTLIAKTDDYFKSFTLILLLICNLCVIKSYSQTTINADKYILWKGVRIYEFEHVGYPDTLETCYGEWITKGKARVLNKLSKASLNRIVKAVKNSRCNIVYVDLKDFYGAKEFWPEGFYCLGFQNRK